MEHDQNCLFCSLFRRYAMSCHIIGFGGMIVLHMTSSWCLLLFLFQNASPAFCVRHAGIQGGSYHWDSFLKISSPTRSIPHGKCHPLMDKIPSPVDINKGSEISHDQFHLETRIQIPSSPQISHKKKTHRWFKKVYNPNFRTSLIARWGQKSNSTTNSSKIYRAPVSAQCTQGSAVETPVQFSRFGASWSFYVVADFFLFWGDHCKICTPKQKSPSTSSYIQTSINPTKLQKTTFTLVNYLRRIKNLELLLCRAPKSSRHLHLLQHLLRLHLRIDRLLSWSLAKDGFLPQDILDLSEIS